MNGLRVWQKRGEVQMDGSSAGECSGVTGRVWGRVKGRVRIRGSVSLNVGSDEQVQ